MKKSVKLFFCLFVLLGSVNSVLSETIVGNVEKNEKIYQNRVIDAQTKNPIPFATVKIPSKNYQTKTDEEGVFNLNADILGSTIMSVEKQGYRPFSITVDKQDLSKPIVVGIEKTQLSDVSLEANIIHLGDDRFSQVSANSSEFKLRSVGPYYSKKFKISSVDMNENAYFVIGSVIGVDTLLSRKMGQSNVTTSYASPAQIFFNGQKIAEIKFNSDGQQILLPKGLIKFDAENEITIKAGKNLFQKSYIDYDDIEVANLSIEYKSAIASEE